MVVSSGYLLASVLGEFKRKLEMNLVSATQAMKRKRAARNDHMQTPTPRGAK